MQGRQEFSFKLVMIGHTEVGKTCILDQLCLSKFNATYKPTLGVEHRIKKFDTDNESVRLQFWDTSGQERFKGMVGRYFAASHGIVFVVDQTNPASFEFAKDRRTEILAQEKTKHLKMFFIGTKSDIEVSETPIDASEVEQYCKEHRMPYYKVSVKDSALLHTVFEKIAKPFVTEQLLKGATTVDEDVDAAFHKAPRKTERPSKISVKRIDDDDAVIPEESPDLNQVRSSPLHTPFPQSVSTQEVVVTEKRVTETAQMPTSMPQKTNLPPFKGKPQRKSTSKPGCGCSIF